MSAPSAPPEPFPFSEAELYLALRMIEPDEEARGHAAEIRAATADQSWAVSEDMLLLLSLVSDVTSAKVDRLRRETRQAARELWRREEQERARAPRLSRASGWLLEDHWAGEVARQDRDWARRREELMRRLHSGCGLIK